MPKAEQLNTTNPPSPNILERVGLLSAAGEIIGADPGPDADLLQLIERYSFILEHGEICWDKARVHKQNSKLYNARSSEAFKYRDEKTRIEEKIATIPARTAAGVAARLLIALQQFDPKGEGPQGTMYELPCQAMREALGLFELWQPHLLPFRPKAMDRRSKRAVRPHRPSEPV